MSKMIQIRNVPDSLHRRLRARAALRGQALSDYLLFELKEICGRPTIEELKERLRERTVVRPGITPSQAVRRERDR